MYVLEKNLDVSIVAVVYKNLTRAELTHFGAPSHTFGFALSSSRAAASDCFHFPCKTDICYKHIHLHRGTILFCSLFRFHTSLVSSSFIRQLPSVYDCFFRLVEAVVRLSVNGLCNFYIAIQLSFFRKRCVPLHSL